MVIQAKPMNGPLGVLLGYASPRTATRSRMALVRNEGQAFAYLLLGCAISFLAQIPYLARADLLDYSNHSFVSLAAGRLLGLLVFAPLLFYAVAALSGIVLRMIKGRPCWFKMRVALFWAVLAASPAVLIQGVLRGFLDVAFVDVAASIAVAMTFLSFWAIGIACVAEGQE